ncbi:branched-chain amino acid ABC transporter permease [Roseomonas sp. NAR14]|uniref:Branched-chain amino acid ABC transporter permease n=1 Tax=Roseomonas acroporae TaxID=2937791 RepID=A0A9X2BYL3_9PROT|nr:branched-chain amino acid ABC transporter permease [Roseomonas acroporae]MCK8787049.1 branched-chain amino acid ABC transporter permease [Roseomonas acroporae]
MREHPARERAALLLLLAAAALLPFLATALGSPATVPLASRIVIYGIAAASLNLILGHGGLVSFGHAAFYGLGGYTVGILYAHLAPGDPFLGLIPGSNQLAVTLPAALLVGGLGAAAIGALSLRTSGVQFIMITLAFAQMLYFLFASLSAYGGDDGLSVRRPNLLGPLNLRDPATMYWVALGALALWLAFQRRLVRSRFGRVLEGIRQNEARVVASGIRPYPYKLAAFVIAGMGAALAGALMVNAMRFVSPDMLHWTKSGELMVMVILGGIGTLLGPVLGALALVVLETGLTALTENWQVVLGPILVVVVLFSQGGLAALFRRRPASDAPGAAGGRLPRLLSWRRRHG